MTTAARRCIYMFLILVSTMFMAVVIQSKNSTCTFYSWVSSGNVHFQEKGIGREILQQNL